MVKHYSSLLLAVTFTILFLLSAAAPGYGQRDFGIRYSVPGNTDQFMADLDEFRQTGIRSLLVQEILDSRQMQVIESAGFDVYVSIPVIFPTIWTLEQNRDDLINQWSRYIEFYRQYNSVSGISLFSFGQIHSERFQNFFRELRREVNTVVDVPVFYISSEADDHGADDLFDHRVYQVTDISDITRLTSFDHIGGFIYAPQNHAFDIQAFQSLLNLTESVSEAPFFLEEEWFRYNKEAGDMMQTVVLAYSSDPNALFPNPRSQGEFASPNWLILILLIIWGSFVGHYYLMPTYRKSLLRFFDNHRFFMNDVMERHIRLGRSSAYILVQQGIVGGLFFLALTKYALSPLGFDALMHHLPVLNSYTPGYLIIFITGFLLFVLINVICTLWLFLMNSGIQNISQAAIFQIWGQHLNLFIITLLITLILAERSILAINIVALLFLVIFFGCFVYATIDAGKYTYTQYFYYPLTLMIYLLILAGLGVWIYFFTGFVELWNLAVML